MVVFSVFFGRLARHAVRRAAVSGLRVLRARCRGSCLPSRSTESSNSVVANQRLITKVYFPRLIMPLAAVCVGLVDFAISFVVLLALLMAYYGIAPGWRVVDAAALDAAGGRHGARASGSGSRR